MEKKQSPVVAYVIFGLLAITVAMSFAGLLSLAPRRSTSPGQSTAYLPPDPQVLPLTLDQFINKERAERRCSVTCFEDEQVDWIIPTLKVAGTGELYTAEWRGWSIYVHPSERKSECSCVPDLQPAYAQRVRGRLTTVSNYLSIDDATIEPVAEPTRLEVVAPSMAFPQTIQVTPAKLRSADRELCMKAAAVAHYGGLGMEWLDGVLRSMQARRTKIDNRWAFFKSALINAAERAGKSYREIEARVYVPPSRQELGNHAPTPAIPMNTN